MSSRVARILLSVLVPASLAACGDVSGPQSERDELDRNRDRWRASGAASYSYVLSRSCFCLVEVTQPSRIQVRNDSVVAVTAVSDGRSLDTRYFVTVNALFDLIDKASEQRAAVIRVVYDPILGYPREIDYDGATNIADDEITYRASELTKTP